MFTILTKFSEKSLKQHKTYYFSFNKLRTMIQKKKI